MNSLERDERNGEFLLATNRGFFRIDPRRPVRRVRGSLTVDDKSSPVGTFLEIKVERPGELIGSGHPDRRTLPQFLGLLRSPDNGRTWRTVSRLGDADLHKIVPATGGSTRGTPCSAPSWSPTTAAGSSPSTSPRVGS